MKPKITFLFKNSVLRITSVFSRNVSNWGRLSLSPNHCGTKQSGDLDVHRELHRENIFKYQYRFFTCSVVSQSVEEAAEITTLKIHTFFSSNQKLVKVLCVLSCCMCGFLFWKYFSPPEGVTLLLVFPPYSAPTATGRQDKANGWFHWNHWNGIIPWQSSIFPPLAAMPTLICDIATVHNGPPSAV